MAVCSEGGNRSKGGGEEIELRGGKGSSPLPQFVVHHGR